MAQLALHFSIRDGKPVAAVSALLTAAWQQRGPESCLALLTKLACNAGFVYQYLSSGREELARHGRATSGSDGVFGDASVRATV